LRVKDTAKIIRHYANSFKVGNIIIYFRENNQDFKFDFGQSYSETGHAELYTMIINSPTYAKELLKILTDSVA
jgi:hypothetical protein